MRRLDLDGRLPPFDGIIGYSLDSGLHRLKGEFVEHSKNMGGQTFRHL